MEKEPMRYRPSNGTEGDWFDGKFCSRCKKNGPCEIIFNSMIYESDEAPYPKEMIYGEDGEPQCTAFEPRTTG